MALLICCLALFLAVVGADCPQAPSSPQDRRTNKAQLRVGTFNAEWLFDGNDQSPWTVAQADAHLRSVAGALASLNLDIIGLQEVKNCEILVRLITQMQNNGSTGYKHYLLQGTDTATGQNVALVTRVDPTSNLQRTTARYNYPISGNTCGSTSSGDTGVSKHFFADFTISGVQYRFFNQHFLAYPTDPIRCVQREAQASVMRGLINTAINANKEIIVFGDYNDYSDAVSDSANDVPTSRVMKILRQGLVGGTWNESDPYVAKGEIITDNAIPSTLVEISASITKSERYTNAYEATKVSMIDHLLVSQGVSDRRVSAEVAHIYARNTVSDHWPVILTIRT